MESLSQEMVWLYLENILGPWRKQQWFIQKVSGECVVVMEDVLDLYAEPYDSQLLVICFGETSTQLLADVRERPGEQSPGELSHCRPVLGRAALDPVQGTYRAGVQFRGLSSGSVVPPLRAWRTWVSISVTLWQMRAKLLPSPNSTFCSGGHRDDGTDYREYWRAT